jgi:hypothetical protein
VKGNVVYCLSTNTAATDDSKFNDRLNCLAAARRDALGASDAGSLYDDKVAGAVSTPVEVHLLTRGLSKPD